jgi:hypothetical protein
VWAGFTRLRIRACEHGDGRALSDSQGLCPVESASSAGASDSTAVRARMAFGTYKQTVLGTAQ